MPTDLIEANYLTAQALAERERASDICTELAAQSECASVRQTLRYVARLIAGDDIGAGR